MRRARLRRLLAEKAALTPAIAMASPGAPFDWYQVPYLQSVPEPTRSYANGAITTDALGLRRVEIAGQLVGLREFDRLPGSKRLLVGGSTAFSMGCSSDRTAIASVLSRLTGDPWFHLAVMCYVSTQELILYQLTDPTNVTDIVLLSGLNTLSAVALTGPTVAPDVFAPNFFLMPGRAASTRQKAIQVMRRSWRRMLNAPMRRRTAVNVTSAVSELALDITRRDLRLWRAIADARGIQLTYLAQPLLPLLDKPLSPEEARILEIQREVGAYEPFALWGFYLTELPQIYPAYCDALGEICRELGIAFCDLNHERQTFGASAWLFADVIHFTDQGCLACAELIAQRFANWSGHVEAAV